ncbi:MAG: hypothetical protein ACREO8_01590, partial [Luteimonas sp.]
RYAALTADDRDLAALDVLRGDGVNATAAGVDSVAVWRDGGFWLLPPLLLLALLAFRRNGAFAMLLLCACLPWQPARAAGDGTLWRRPDQADHLRMQQAAEAYRKQDFTAAEQAWKALPGADAAYNRGNALAQAGQYRDAIAAYDAALRARPAMADAIANRKAVEAAMQRKPPPSKQSGNGGKPRNDNGQPDDGQADPQHGQAARQPGKPDPGDGRDTPPTAGNTATTTPRSDGTPSPPPKPANAQAQRSADAAQRERMRQALQGAPQRITANADGTPPTDKTPINQTLAQRERRQASDAWLKRVPDDPGGLLRAKFRLEYERRRQTGAR